jgi:hypothetical protein
MGKYGCMDCQYQSSLMGCMERIKNNCEGCHLHDERYAYSCRCTSHELSGEECPDFKLLEDNNGQKA